ncbi:hypothetical protein Asppvi_004833 [Aspergillus pseudoviridinutans]|uniref:Uncharacterized protein n=1 Tax=Aspergillus pseudoviridinutans TaxID=1517512 RepID=A0A9P3B766_9EURO|nr:uncharacterized protein Asppvi_004833 [Aspergillus pseudoviridinutans]GIJ85962.1 hypothetical protein Asppvi_004833 [Aspergillus pseudoviridinutans]
MGAWPRTRAYARSNWVELNSRSCETKRQQNEPKQRPSINAHWNGTAGHLRPSRDKIHLYRTLSKKSKR